MRVHTFDYANAGLFFPSLTPADRLRAYGVVGGMPAYPAACDPERSLEDNIRATVLRDDACLRREPEYLLSQERSVDRPWECACQDFLWRAFRNGSLGDVGFDRMGWWWEGRGAAESAEIDAVALDGKRVALVASCKWRNEYAKIGDLFELRRAAQRIGADEHTRQALFSRSGFDPSLVALAQAEGVWLVTPEQMYADAGRPPSEASGASPTSRFESDHGHE